MNENRICAPCYATCATCSGPNSNQCLTCHELMFFFEGSCLTNCPVQYYNNGNQCSPCHATC